MSSTIIVVPIAYHDKNCGQELRRQTAKEVNTTYRLCSPLCCII